MSDLALLERLLAKALLDADPAAALRRASRNRGLPSDLRRRLAAVDVDGFRLSALLVARLRFERLLRASPASEAWFERDPEGFTAAFRAYHRSVRPTALFPSEEARLFDGWRRDGRR